jgi:hypothetical protein
MEDKHDHDNKNFVFSRLREEITYEANLIVQRTSWFVGSQAFFFASLAIGMDQTVTPKDLTTSVYFPLIPILSFIVCTLTILSVHAAAASASVYRERLDTFVNKNREYEHLWRKPTKMVYHLGLLSTQFLPIVFLIAWFYILILPVIDKFQI